MAAARAIVASDQGGMPELIQHGANGLLAHSESPQSYVAQLETLIDDPLLRRRLGTAARQSIETHYTDTQIADRTLDVYRP